MPKLEKFDNLAGTEERLCCLISDGCLENQSFANG